jgi:uncharacterized membrane protein required for colicin V production
MGRHAPKRSTVDSIDHLLMFLAGVATGVFGIAIAYSYHPYIADWSSRIIIGATIAISGAVTIALVSIQIIRRRKE